MIFGYDNKLMKKLDSMLDGALAGTFEAQAYTFSVFLSKVKDL